MKTSLPPAIVLPKLPPIQREFVFTDDDFDRVLGSIGTFLNR